MQNWYSLSPIIYTIPNLLQLNCLLRGLKQNPLLSLTSDPLPNPLRHKFSPSVNLTGTIFKICVAFTNTSCHSHCYFFGPSCPDYCQEPLNGLALILDWINSGYSASIQQPEWRTKEQVERHHSSPQYQLWLLPISQDKTKPNPPSSL